MEIVLLNQRQLSDFIQSDEFKSLESIPITKHRALSQIKNPRLDTEDILLLLAYENNQLVGYLGALPDKFFINNQFEKCSWLSCLWIDPEHRGKQIAQQLLFKSHEAWKGKLLITEFTHSAKMLYVKSNLFNDLKINEGIRLYIRSDLANLLPPKKEIFRKIKFLLEIADQFSNAILDFRFLFKNKKNNAIKFESIDTIDSEIENFISTKQGHQVFKRSTIELNWILKNPWVLSSPLKDEDSKRYHFSSSDQSFNFFPVKIRTSDNILIGFIIFSKRNETLKLPYCYYDKSYLENIIEVIYWHLKKWEIKTFTTYHSEITKYLSHNKTPTLFKRNVNRHYMISKILDQSIKKDELEIQDGDGDCSFT